MRMDETKKPCSDPVIQHLRRWTKAGQEFMLYYDI
jgi:hypothetical protein